LPNTLPAQLKGEVIAAFMGATRTVFIIFVPVSIIVGILSLFVEVEIHNYTTERMLTSPSRMSDWAKAKISKS
jgi:hypothetical protein